MGAPPGVKRAALTLLLLCACLPRGRWGSGADEGPAPARLESLAEAGAARDGAAGRTQAEGLSLSFAGTGGAVEASPEALGWPRDLRRFGRLVAILENGAAPARVTVSVAGPHGRLWAARDLGARWAATLEIALDDLPLVTPATAPFEPQVVRVESSAPRPSERTLLVRALSLEPGTTPADRPRVDAFGQRASADWPGKPRRPEDLAAAARDERRALAAQAPPPDRGPYGGWTQGPNWQEGGFFSVEQDGEGRAWLVDPQGNAFWSVGVSAVGTRADATPVAGREWLFERLPDPASREGREVYLTTPAGPALLVYRWNVLRKWGSIATWRELTLDRLTRWGVNTISGDGTDPDLLVQRRLPHTRTLHTLQAPEVPRTPAGFPDVFDPRWAAFVDKIAAAHGRLVRDNPWLLGTFVDDEPRWAAMRLLEAPRGTHLRARWSVFVREMHEDLPRLNAAWRTRLASWDEVRDATEATLPAGRAREDLAAFEALYAETYFGVIADALRKHAPHHLYLGCRFGRVPPPNEAVVRAAGKHVDLLSVAWDALAVDRTGLERWHVLSGRPVLVAAHGVALLSERQIAPPGAALPPAERRAHYVRFLTALASLPFVVGAHWSQYVDHPLTGRLPDGANQPNGLVDVTDRPHDDLFAALREAAARVYPLHSSSR